nr:MAG TPA: hypothetical protein [Caudoviricetes sp.]
MPTWHLRGNNMELLLIILFPIMVLAELLHHK